MDLVSVAALTDDRLIGKGSELPWPSIPEDKRQYRNRIADSPVILGRLTFESMLDDLPGRAQLVMSRSEREHDVDTAIHVESVEEALTQADELDAETAYVIGGGAIYDLFQPSLDRMLLSRVHGEYEGDTYYPEWDQREWELVEKTPYDRFTLEEWERRDTE